MICERGYKLIAKGQIFDALKSQVEWSRPDLNLKHQLWEMITDPDNQDSLQTYYWKEDAFCQVGNQPGLMEQFFDNFYNVAPIIVHS